MPGHIVPGQNVSLDILYQDKFIPGHYVPGQNVYMDSRGVQNVKKMDSELAEWFFPLDRMSGDTTKNFSSLAKLECPSQATQKYKYHKIEFFCS